jgi:hypothetical protein
MCYSVESSLKTTLLSGFAIIILLNSQIPHFQWIGVTLIGWCGMQFAELLLWLTKPRTECTYWNKVITMTLIPLVLVLQPIGSLWGSLYVINWKNSTETRKLFMYVYSVLIILLVSFEHYNKPEKICTTVTKKGHLNWNTKSNSDYIMYFGWAFLIFLPILLFWDTNILFPILLLITPIFGFIFGLYTDSKPSVWCYYTSYTSIISVMAYMIQIYKIYDFFPITTKKNYLFKGFE